MSVNGVTNATQNYDRKTNTKVKEQPNKNAEALKQEDAAAVYEKSEKAPVKKAVYERDSATVDRLLAEAEKRTESLRKLVESMLIKQGQTFNDSTDIYALLREGKLDVDPETRAQAQKDIAEDGYWGVEQTSERLLSFAKALTGGDPSKAEEMIEAVKKGFEEATKAWGGELPEISKRTLDSAISKMEAWRDSLNTGSDNSTVKSNVDSSRKQ